MFFDVWVKDSGNVIYTQEQELLFEVVWKYIYDRIAFLIDEIEEEENKALEPPAIMIYLLQKPYAIQPRGYSDRLNEKIVGCFNERDVEIMWKSVEDKIMAYWN